MNYHISDMHRRISAREEFPLADIFIMIAAVIGVIVYFWLLPANHPDAAAAYNMPTEKVATIAANYLKDHGYDAEVSEADVALMRQVDLLNTLQAVNGRERAVALLKSDASEQLPGYFWRVAWNADDNMQMGAGSGGPPSDLRPQVVYLTLDGSVWQFRNETLLAPRNRDNRNVLLKILSSQVRQEGLLAGMPPEMFFQGIRDLSDSTLVGLFYFNIPDSLGREAIARLEEAPARIDIQRLLEYQPQELDARAAATMARYHLNVTAFDQSNLQVDSVWTMAEGNRSIASVRFRSMQPVYGHNIEPRVTVSSDGSLIQLETRFEPVGDRSIAATIRSTKGVIDGISGGIWVLWIVLFVILFFRRMSARLVDTGAALLDALLAGVSIAVFNALLFGNTIDELLTGPIGRTVQIFLSILFGAAGGGLVMFLVSGSTDSIRRSLWDEKGRTLEFLRRMEIHNQPVGWALLRGAAIGMTMLGVLTLILQLVPDGVFYFAPDHNGTRFMGDSTLAPYLFVLFVGLFNGLLFFSMLLNGFGVWLGRSGRAWLVVGGVGFLFSLAQLVPDTLVTGIWPWVNGLVLGCVIGWTFWKFDFITALVAFLAFFIIWNTSEGWLVGNSPDMVSVWFSGVFVVALLIAGGINVFTGKSESEVPRYVPPYIEAMARQERLQRELEIAREVQQSFLPKQLPEIEGVQIAAVCQPAQEVGGDYFDVIRIDGNRLAVAIGDVSGKGIQAAFFMTLVKGFVQTLAIEAFDPAEVLKRLNKLFFANAQPGIFISMIYGILDVEQKTFHFARAGHNPLLLKRSPSQEAEVIQPDGMAVGLVNGPRFDDAIEEMSIHLREGDVLVFFTDGFSEAMNEERAMFGQKRLADRAGELGKYEPDEIVSVITKEVNSYSNNGGIADDMTMLVIKLTSSVSGIAVPFGGNDSEVYEG